MKTIFLITVIFLFILTASFSLAAPIGTEAHADSNAIRVPQDCSSIQEAIGRTSPGGTIYVSSGTYHENLFIDKALTLIGEDQANTFIIGSGSGSVIQANFTTVNVSGFNITGGANGIMLETCNGSTIKNNNINGRTYGIWLYHSNGNTVSDNFLSGSWSGVVLCGHSSANTVTRNTMKDNKNGISLSGWNNLIYHNNFVNNENQTEMLASFNNTWDNTLEGNYWSNYGGQDYDQDGLGDTPRLIDINNQDNHPLMGMFCQFQVSSNGTTYSITTISNSTITDLHLKDSISLDVTGPENTTGFCRISLPSMLFGHGQSILVNGLPPIMLEELPATNITHTYLYLTYAVETQNTVLTSGILIPIAASVAVLCILIATVVTKKTRSNKEIKWPPV